ncbi:Metallocarboxypeptidase A-like protein [Neonectria ditissima]|uniref:Metallocarboxypeptidase A-like protein n=1 Tax=Neonectria ditissima TaxID=78410 RepID=A0A0P7BB40_9HYPO|nr:Metallocarboxypeptidase A-like protein [Neonectria ditissima]
MRFTLSTSLLVSLALSVAAAPSPNAKSYDGYKVFRVKTHGDESSVEQSLAKLSYEEWAHEAQFIDIVLPPNQLDAFEALGLDSHVMHEDLGDSITSESSTTQKWKRQADDLAWYDSYHKYEDHLQYFKDLHKLFPKNSKIISSGKSYEKRTITGLHLWGKGGPGKPAVLYHGTVHAREWISTLTVEYIALQLIKGYKDKDKLVQSFLDSYDFYILPIVNPDGFLYTQTNDRLWRKNRQPPPSGSCIGRDINRNWEFGWNANALGASTNPCSQTYKGEKASDSPENRGLDKLVRKLRDGAGIKLFIDWHSYGQYILSPYGYNETLYAPELGKWTKAAALVSETIRDSSDARTTFTFGPSGATLYTTTGAAPDHVYSIGGADFSYTIELRDTGDFGFVLPPAQIRPTAEEQWEGQKVLLSLLDEVFFDGEGPA